MNVSPLLPTTASSRVPAASDTYTPVAADVEDLLVAVALYTDGSPNEDDAKDFAMMVTAAAGLGGHAKQSACVP